MRRLEWLCCGLVAVFLGLTLPVAGQFPGPSGSRAAPAKQPPANGVKIGAEDYNRLREILVELAWLADPSTFPCLLEAHMASTSLQVKGRVPNRAVHERALQIARLHCPMTVADGLREGSHAAR